MEIRRYAMHRLITLFLFATLAILAFCSTVMARDMRVALVIGNGALTAFKPGQ